jgi:hypothetical protein
MADRKDVVDVQRMWELSAVDVMMETDLDLWMLVGREFAHTVMQCSAKRDVVVVVLDP